jgi:hypothetical protein
MRWIAIFLVGLGAGWVLREATLPRESRARPARVEVPAPPETPRESPRPPATVNAPETPPEAAAKESAPAASGGDFKGMIESQIPAMKGYVSAAAKTTGREMASRLGLEGMRAERLAQVIAEDAARQVEEMFRALLGEGEAKIDPDAAFGMQGVPAKLSTGAEHELATFLSGDEIGAVRAELEIEHEKQVDRAMEMQVAMMAIPDLTAEQRTQVKALLREEGAAGDQAKVFAETMRAPEKLEGDGLEETMERSFAPRREKMRRLLDARQFEKYLEFEKRAVEQARMGLEMAKSFRKPAAER